VQAADIMLYEGDVVPVGKDQLPFLELTREVIRRFNHFYKSSFPEPEDRLTSFATLLGVDGRKMSKSYNNTIPISLSESDMTKRLMGMMTDPARVRRTDPGNPDVCPVYNYHQIYTDKKRCQEIDSGCRSAELGCVVCKQECAGTIVASLSDFRERRAYYETHLSEVNTMLKEGAIRANEVAENTMGRVRELVGL
jgi:Tryptophanyl-tRNA synthetase